ncbi:LptA/OstA family protein [Aurantimonas sp. A2-1-M11]|uniref:LptA/OstA family protein n=1 Tax=Aurantimonas sp. A2-1-M11 TaxID=3113712 RepID=UPI002F953E0A
MRSFISRSAIIASAALLAGLAVGSPVGAQQTEPGLGQSFGGLQVDGDQPISIESNQLVVDDAQAIATFTGNVQVEQGETELRTGRLVVTYKKDESADGQASRGGGGLPGGSNQIERLEASEKVYVKSADQVATADQADFDMTSQVVVMRGNVVLTQGQNVAEGCRLTIQMDTGLARLESSCDGVDTGGRVRLMLTPGAGQATN